MSRVLPVIGVVPIDQMRGEDAEDTRLLVKLRVEAELYLSKLNWFPGVVELFYGGGIGGILAIFLVRTHPNAFSAKGTAIDQWLWVIAGDLPSAYLVTDGSKKPSEACEAYIYQLSRWVERVEAGETQGSDVMPLDVQANPAMASALSQRLVVIEELVLPAIREIEAAHNFN
jgi:hypothetical protein